MVDETVEIQGPRTHQIQRPQAASRGRAVVFAAAVLAAALAATWLWWSRSQPEPTPAETARSAPKDLPPALPPERGVQYPIAPPDATPQEALDITAALTDLLGRKAVGTFLQTIDFPRRFAATVDNLGREHAPPLVWPVTPTAGRFTVEERPDGTVIAPENATRYTPFVLLAGTLDVSRAIDLYRKMYPQLQQAYQELGLGNRYLNDRVVEVIDLLLASPEPVEPPRVQLTEVKGPIPSERPWVRYEFVDPSLESLTAGQKIMVRMGPFNQRRLKNKLLELREQLVAGQAARVVR